MWDIATLELTQSLEGHENPVCTIGIANGMLFSGSLKVIKVCLPYCAAALSDRPRYGTLPLWSSWASCKVVMHDVS